MNKLIVISSLFLALTTQLSGEEFKPAGILLGDSISNYKYNNYSDSEGVVEAPNPIKDFNIYSVTLYQEKITMVNMLSKNFEDSTGSSCVNRYNELKANLTSKYDTPSSVKEYTDPYYVENPNRFNYGLKIGLNEFASAWFLEEAAILLMIGGSDHYSCFLSLGYKHSDLYAQKKEAETSGEVDNL